ncbi:threonine synthase [Campylobacter novaezeelandiae]|uniref:threonine synthase n=2 Tax=Campylobacter novaezeelandiae TaxID=2267891 RepID=UPI0019080AD3|nr:threonine synthase [Campylobacter novaezeelandiae]MBK1964255.1 threonine synthase [Campylobacter novaezeelandiae]
MQLVSTRDRKNKVDFKEALINPSAKDGGLYTFDEILPFNAYNLKDLSYEEFALKFIEQFHFGYIDLFKKAVQTYKEFDDKTALFLRKVNENLFINELYHGPTRAFKDMALQPFGVLLNELNKNDKILIICATSGDTGPATLKSFEKFQNTKVVCIYPKDGTSEIQALQMQALNKNHLRVFAIEGNFDDAQNTLKKLLLKDDFKRILSNLDFKLCVANSINFGRILFQMIYHYYACVKLDKVLDVIVPSGNFGNALAAYYAKKMGAKIDRIKIATNSNDVLSDFFNQGIYDIRERSLKKTISPAMDILISSNIERLLFDKFKDLRTKELMNDLKEKKYFYLNKDELDSLKQDFDASSCSDLECMNFIKKYSKDFLIDPHTATCFKLLDEDKSTLITSTAEWTKFTPSIYKALFDKESNNEKEAMLEIALKFDYQIKPDLLALFDIKNENLKAYKCDELENEIIDWIKQ